MTQDKINELLSERKLEFFALVLSRVPVVLMKSKKLLVERNAETPLLLEALR